MSLAIPDDRGPGHLVTTERLVAAVQAVAKRSLENPKVRAALAAAESIPAGIVLSSEDAAAGVVDAVRTIIDGEKVLSSELRAIIRISDAMDEAARGAVVEQRLALLAAKERGNLARVAYQALVRKQAAEAEAAARRRAAEVAEAAAVRAAELGEDEPPEAEVAPVVVPRAVVAGVAKSGTAVRVEASAITDWEEVPAEWLQLLRAPAENAFRLAEMQGKVKRAAPGESVVWQGVRFTSVERAANR